MRKNLFAALVGSAVLITTQFGANAQMMIAPNVNSQEVAEHTAQKEKEGKIIWQKLQSKELSCENLSEYDFAALGEYYMGQMTGDSHAAMNEMMMRMMGESSEEAMHVVMGKRLSGCNISAEWPAQNFGFMPMMYMMTGGRSPLANNQFINPMMWNWSGSWGWGIFGWTFMILWWLLLAAAIVAIVKWLINQFKGSSTGLITGGKSALDILKERYARGEISKEEFENIKRDL